MQYDLRKVLLFFLILVLPAFIFKEYHVLKSARESYVATPAPEQKRDNIDHHFVFVIISQENADFGIKTLSSIFSQDYHNYRVIFIDNGSQDGSFDVLQSYLFKRHSFRKNLALIRHKERKPFAKAFKEALKECDENEIVVLLKPSDWLTHQNVLTSLNEAYADPEVWLTYTASLEYPSYRKFAPTETGLKTYTRKPYRTPWLEAGMRTFYARLMHNMDIDENTTEEDLFLPMINLSKWHIRYIPDTLYIHNRLTMPGSMHRLQLGLRLDELTRSIHSQSNLAKYQHTQPPADAKADMIIFSGNQPFQLGVSLESIYRYVRGIDTLYVLYDSSPAYKQAYADLQKRYPKAIFREQSPSSSDFKPLLLSLLTNHNHSSHFVAFATDGLLIKDPIYFQDCVSALTQTKAFAFFLDSASLSLSSHPKNTDHNRIHIIEIEQSQVAAPLNMVIYRKPDLITELSTIEFTSPKSLLKSWKSDTRRLGLFYDVSKVVHMH